MKNICVSLLVAFAALLPLVPMEASAAPDLEKGMQCAVKKYGFAGSNVFTGDPMTTTKGPSVVADPKYQGYVTASKDAKLASFPKGVGLIGRAWVSEAGYEFSPNVQDLDAKKFLRLSAAKTHGVKGTVALLVAKDTVVEFFSGDVLKSVDVEGIKACFK